MSKDDDMRTEYPEDLIKSGARGKYVAQYRKGTNVVLIEPDLHKIFPNSKAVNEALREYAANKHLSDLLYVCICFANHLTNTQSQNPANL